MPDVDANYATVEELKDHLGVTGSDDDEQYARLITAASRTIDRITGQRFYTPTNDETRVFDVPAGDELYFDTNLYSLTSITNGDGTSISLSDVLLYPPNEYPKTYLRLKASSGVVFLPDNDGETSQVIQVTGKWGFSDEPDNQVKLATMQLVGHVVSRQGSQGVRTKRIGEYLVTFQKMQSASDLPDDVKNALIGLVRPTFA